MHHDVTTLCMFCKLHSMCVILLVQDKNLRSFMVFAWTKHKTGKQKGEFKRKEKIGHHEKKKIL